MKEALTQYKKDIMQDNALASINEKYLEDLQKELSETKSQLT